MTCDPDEPPLARFDVLVVGGGPAGSTLGVMLARAGRDVVVAERTDFETERPGETVPPDTAWALAAAGLDTGLLDDGHLPNPGVLSAWGAGEPLETDFLFQPQGDGRHLDRRRFDRALVESARAAGARVLTSTTVSALRRRDAGWVATLTRDGRSIVAEARYLVLATGRDAFVPCHGFGRRIVVDRLVALAAYVDVEGLDVGDRRLVVEATAEGWWYTAPLPGGRRVITWITDADEAAAATPVDRRALWTRRRASAVHVTRACPRTPECARVVAFSATVAHADSVVGPGWARVGDAALAPDPLSGQGVVGAILSAGALASSLAPIATAALASHADQRLETAHAARCAEHQMMRARLYGAPAPGRLGAFWRRRPTHPVAAPR